MVVRSALFPLLPPIEYHLMLKIILSLILIFLSFQLIVSDAAGNSFTTHSVSPYISDTSPPVPTSLTNDAPGNGFLKIGDSITFNLSMQSDEPGLQVSATYNSEDIHFNYKLGSLGSYYQATYTIDESHAPYNGTTEQLIVSAFLDRAGNEGSLAVLNNVRSNVNTGFDNILPSINSIKYYHSSHQDPYFV